MVFPLPHAPGRSDPRWCRVVAGMVGMVILVGRVAADEPLRLAIGDAAAAEPPVGAGVISMMVSLSGPSASGVTASYETVADTATAADFTPQTGTVELPAGTTRALIRIPVREDAAAEEPERFFVRLSLAQGAELTRAVGRATILNAGIVPVVHSPGGVLYENAPPTSIPLQLAPGGATESTVHWQLQPWFSGPPVGFAPATPGADFDPTPGVVVGSGPMPLSLAALTDTLVEPPLDPRPVSNPTEVLALRFLPEPPTVPASFVPDFEWSLPANPGELGSMPHQLLASTDGTWIATGFASTSVLAVAAPTRLTLYRRNAALQRTWAEAPPLELGDGRSPVSLLMRRGRLAVNTLKGLALYEAPESEDASAWLQVNTPDAQGTPLPPLQYNVRPSDFAFDGDTLISVRLGINPDEPDIVVFHERLAPSGSWGVVQEEPLPANVRLRSIAVDGDLAVVCTSIRTRLEEWRRTGPPDRPWIRKGEIPAPPPTSQYEGDYGRLALAGGVLHARRYDSAFAIAGHVFRCGGPGQWRLEQDDLPAIDEQTGETTFTFLSSEVFLFNARMAARSGPPEAPWQLVTESIGSPLDAQGGVLLQHYSSGSLETRRLLVAAPGAQLTIYDEQSAWWAIGVPDATNMTVTEPKSGPTSLDLRVHGPFVPFATSVGIRTVAGGTATPGVDFVPIDLPLHQLPLSGFGPNSVPLRLLADREIESNETVRVALHSPSYGRLFTADPTEIIVRDAATTVSAAAQNVFLAEPEAGHLDQNVPFLLTLPVTTDTQIPILVDSRGATPVADFLLPATTVTVPAGARSFVVPVRIFADALAEPVESFFLRLGASSFATPSSLRVQVNVLDRLDPGHGTEADEYQPPQNAAFAAGGGAPAAGVTANDAGMPSIIRLSHPPHTGTLSLNPSGSFSYTPPVNFIGQTRFAYEGRLGDGLGTLVEGTATWKYLHPLDGVDPAVAQPAFQTSWMTVGYNDAAWPSGTGLLGYGGFGTANTAPDTNIGTPTSGQRYSAYLRQTFSAPQSVAADLELQFYCDDAVIFYLNGVEIGRFVALPDPAFATAADAYKLVLSSGAVDGAQETTVRTLTVRSAPLAATGNVLAVSVHNASNTSSDLGFRLLSLKALEQWSEPTPVTLVVTDAALPPVVSADSFSCAQNETLDSRFVPTGGLYGNDRLLDPEGRAYDPILELEISPSAAGGQITATPQTGEFQYVPAAGHYGPDLFIYRVRDKDGWSAPAVVSIDVTPSNGYDQWRQTHLGAVTPTPETAPEGAVKNNGFTNLEAYYFMEDQFSWLPVSSTPLTLIQDESGAPGIEFTGLYDTDVHTLVEGSPSLQPDSWSLLARWQGKNFTSVAPGVRLYSYGINGQVHRLQVFAPPPFLGPRYFRVRLELPPH